MTADEADAWEAAQNPWGEGAVNGPAVNPWGEGASSHEMLEVLAQQLSLHPDVALARDKGASTADRLAAMDRLQLLAGGGAEGGAAGIAAALPSLLGPPPSSSHAATKGQWSFTAGPFTAGDDSAQRSEPIHSWTIHSAQRSGED